MRASPEGVDLETGTACCCGCALLVTDGDPHAGAAGDASAAPVQVLSLMLEQSGLHLGSFPETPFRLKEWTVKGSHCVLDKTPDRMLDIQVTICPQQTSPYHTLYVFTKSNAVSLDR